MSIILGSNWKCHNIQVLTNVQTRNFQAWWNSNLIKCQFNQAMKKGFLIESLYFSKTEFISSFRNWIPFFLFSFRIHLLCRFKWLPLFCLGITHSHIRIRINFFLRAQFVVAFAVYGVVVTNCATVESWNKTCTLAIEDD